MIMKTVMKNKIIDCRMAKGRLLYVFLTSWATMCYKSACARCHNGPHVNKDQCVVASLYRIVCLRSRTPDIIIVARVYEFYRNSLSLYTMLK